MTTPGWDGARAILAVRLDGVGDVLMTTPALRALRSVPGTRVTLLTSRAGAAVGGLVAEVDDVIAYDPPWMKHGLRTGPGADRAIIERLADAGFDAAVIFTVFTQSPLPAALTTWLAGIQLRAAHCRENPYALLTDWISEPEPLAGIRHEVRRQLDLVAALGRTTDDERLSLAVPPRARARVDALLADLGLEDGSPWVVVHPGATAPSRRYPAERFAEIAGRLEECGVAVVFTGSEQERRLVDDVRAAAGCGSSLAGALDLAELAAMMASASAVVTNNTGPAHIAAAVGTPVADLYAYTNPQHTPWGVASRVLYQDVPCRNCFKSVCPMGHHACLRGVPVERVVSAVSELLASAAPSGRLEDRRRRFSARSTRTGGLPSRAHG